MKFWYGPGSGEPCHGSGYCFFVSGWQDVKQRIIFFLSKSFAYYCLKGYLVIIYISFQLDKKSKRSHKIAEIKDFLTFLLVDGRIRVRTVQNNDWSGSTTLERIWHGFASNCLGFATLASKQLSWFSDFLWLERTGTLVPVVHYKVPYESNLKSSSCWKIQHL